MHARITNDMPNYVIYCNTGIWEGNRIGIGILMSGFENLQIQ
jgi:hypothetical protein